MPIKTLNRLDLCSAAELPEKAGLDELSLHVIEDRKFATEYDALAHIEALGTASRFVAVQAMVPKIPVEVAKAIEKFRASLPGLKEKLDEILMPDAETGEPTWRQKLQAKIVARVKAKKCATEPCDNCGSRIATEYLGDEDWFCPVCKTHPFMMTNGDKEAFEAKETKIAELAKTVQEGDARIAEMEKEALENCDEFKRMWLLVEVLREEAQVEEAPAPEVPAEAAVEVPEPVEV